MDIMARMIWLQIKNSVENKFKCKIVLFFKGSLPDTKMKQSQIWNVYFLSKHSQLLGCDTVTEMWKYTNHLPVYDCFKDFEEVFLRRMSTEELNYFYSIVAKKNPEWDPNYY